MTPWPSALNPFLCFPMCVCVRVCPCACLHVPPTWGAESFDTTARCFESTSLLPHGCVCVRVCVCVCVCVSACASHLGDLGDLAPRPPTRGELRRFDTMAKCFESISLLPYVCVCPRVSVCVRVSMCFPRRTTRTTKQRRRPTKQTKTTHEQTHRPKAHNQKKQPCDGVMV